MKHQSRSKRLIGQPSVFSKVATSGVAARYTGKTLAMAMVVLLQGCAIPTHSDADQNQATAISASEPLKHISGQQAKIQDNTQATNLDSPVGKTPVYNAVADKKLNSSSILDILHAELLLKRGQYDQAFELFFKIAEQSSDVKLIKRAFQASMATYDEEKIRRATALWLELEPTASMAWRAAFVLSLQVGQVDKAFSEWQKYQTLSKLPLEQDLLMTAQRVAAAAPQEAGMSFFQKIVNKYPQQWTSHLGFAMVAATHSMPELAIDSLQESIEQAQVVNYPQIYQLLASLYVDASRVDEGIPDLKKYLQQYPDDLMVNERLARLQVLAEDYPAALARYKAIVETKSDAHKARLSLALLQIELEDYVSAVEHLENLAQQKNYQAVANYYLGISFQELGEYDKALSRFEQVLDTNFKVDALLHRSEIFFAQNKVAAAYAELDRVPVASPENRVKMLRAKAIFKSYQEQFDEALIIYNEILAIEPSNVSVLLAKSYIFYNKQRYEDYEALLQTILEKDSNNVEALNGLGYFYAERKHKLPVAKQLLQRALKLQPNNYYILDSMGWVHYQMEDYSSAVRYLEQAFSIKVDEEVFAHLVQAYIKNDQTDKAQRIWKKYYNQFKTLESVAKLKTVLPSGFEF